MKEKYTINTSAEFANELVSIMAKKLGSSKTKVIGGIVSTLNLKENSEFSKLLAHAEVKQFQGVKRFLIDTEMTGDEILNFLDKNPKSFFALSFEIGKDKLKIKPKAPKASKGKKGEEPKADFCKLITFDKELGSGFVFEKNDFKDAVINHTFIIDSLILPEGEKDFAKIREIAKRKGKIIRKAEIDGKKVVTEKEFEA